jgi:hypothetical protein
MNMKFNLKDRVKTFEQTGTIVGIDSSVSTSRSQYLIKVDGKDKDKQHFEDRYIEMCADVVDNLELNGRGTWHREDELTLVELPSKWCVEVNRSNHNVLLEWRTLGSLSTYGYISNSKKDVDGYWTMQAPNRYTEITFDEFVKFVLNKYNPRDISINIQDRETAEKVLSILTQANEPIYDGSSIHYSSPDGDFAFENGKWQYMSHKDRRRVSLKEFIEAFSHTELDSYTIERDCLRDIYPHVCSEWQRTIKKLLVEDGSLFRNEVTVSKELVALAYKAASNINHDDWLEKHFPKPKKMVTKNITAWLNVYDDDHSTSHKTKKEADEAAIITRVACVEVSGVYEVEE